MAGANGTINGKAAFVQGGPLTKKYRPTVLSHGIWDWGLERGRFLAHPLLRILIQLPHIGD